MAATLRNESIRAYLQLHDIDDEHDPDPDLAAAETNKYRLGYDMLSAIYHTSMLRRKQRGFFKDMFSGLKVDSPKVHSPVPHNTSGHRIAAWLESEGTIEEGVYLRTAIVDDKDSQLFEPELLATASGNGSLTYIYGQLSEPAAQLAIVRAALVTVAEIRSEVDTRYT